MLPQFISAVTDSFYLFDTQENQSKAAFIWSFGALYSLTLLRYACGSQVLISIPLS